MKVAISNPETWKRVVDIEIPKEEVETLYNKKIDTVKKKLSLPGFRAGKVPLAILKTRFGKGVFAETVEDLVQEKFEAACKENNITPVSRGVLSNLKGDEGTDVSFTISTEVDPPVEIKGYDKLKIKVAPIKIKDDDVDKAIEELRERSAEFKDVDRAAEKGDFLTIEYSKVVVDDTQRTDFKNPTYPIELGKSQFKEFDKGLAGSKAGEVVEISLKFPKDFAGEQLAGKRGVFSVKINKVAEKLLPDLNEEFLKKIGPFTDFDSLKIQVRADLEQQEAQRAKNEAYNEAIDTLIKNNPFEVPPSRVEDYIDHLMEEMARYRRVNEPEANRNEVKEKYRESAMRALKRFRIIDFVAAREKIKAAQEDVDTEIEKIAKSYNQPFEQVKQAFRQNGAVNRIRADIREQKTLDYLIGEYVPAAQ